MINPGLAPWAMQEYRPYRALLRLPYQNILETVARSQKRTKHTQKKDTKRDCAKIHFDTVPYN